MQTRTDRNARFVSFAVAGLIAVACGGGSGGTGTAQPTNGAPSGSVATQPSTPASSAPGDPAADGACALLTPAEIEDATGIKAEPPDSLGEVRGTVGCHWQLDSGVLHYVEVFFQRSGGEQQFDFLANDFYETPPEPVPGLGDAAVKTATIPAGHIYVLSGDQLLILDFELPLDVDGDPYDVVEPLAHLALSRLSAT
jgi:hypothetical protein